MNLFGIHPYELYADYGLYTDITDKIAPSMHPCQFV